MATSSIFASFDIKDKEKASRFVNALEESANDVPFPSTDNIGRFVTDPDEIKSVVRRALKRRERS